MFSWERFFHNVPIILKYFPVTLKIVLAGEVLGILLALVIALVRINRVPVLSQFFAVFIFFMRGTPMLLQIFLVYYGMPELLKAVLGFDVCAFWPRLTFVYIAFALNQGAFLSENFRSSILAIPKSQMEAGLSVGLTSLQTFKRIVLPQAFRIALPALGVDLVYFFQGTSIAYLVGVIDMVGMARTIGSNSGHTLESFVFIAIIFIVVSMIIKFSFYMLEKHGLNRWVKG